MDLFLILYILILMTLFFFLGAAIGGAARSFKTYFFGFKENEYYCCEADSAREQALVEGSTVGKAALATTAVVAAADQAQDDIVKINQDEVRVDETKEWNGVEANQDDQNVDIEAPVHRDEEANIEPQTTDEDVAQPIATDEITHEDGFQEAVVVRDDEATSVQPTPQDEGAPAPIEWDDANNQTDYDDVVFQAEGPSDDLTLINGIDETFQSQLNELGLHRFEQIAKLTEREVGFLRSKFGFTSLLNEQVWIEQAQILAAGGATVFSQQQADGETSEAAAGDTSEKAALAAAAAAVVNEVVSDEPKEDVAQAVVSEEQTQVEESTKQQAEEADKDDSPYEQRFDYEHEGQETAESEEGDYESRFAYEGEEQEAAENVAAQEDEDVAAQQAEEADKDDSPYEQRFDYEHDGQEKAEPEEGDYESRFAYEGEEQEAAENVAAQEDEDVAAQQTEEADKDDSPYEQRFDYEHEGQEKTEPEDGDYESRFAYEGEEQEAAQGAEDTEEDVAVLQDEEPVEGDSTYEQRFDYEHDGQEKAEPEEGDYESRFAYESDEQHANERLISQEEGDDGRLFGQEARQQRDEEWRERYQNERKILPPGQRGEQLQAEGQGGGQEAVMLSPAVDSDDLQQIKFISTGIEKKLNLLGVYKLSQISQWSQEDVDHISEELEFKGRIEEENWISQAAQILAATQHVTKAEDPTTSLQNAGSHELDQLSDLSEDEKELLLSNGIARLSQIASWSNANVDWVESLLQIKDPARILNWIEIAKKAQAGQEVVPQERAQSLETVTVVPKHKGDHELDQLTDLTEDEKELLLSNGIVKLSQISSWSISDAEKAASLLQIEDSAKVANWIEIAKNNQTVSEVHRGQGEQSLEAVASEQTQDAIGELDQITDISRQEKQLLSQKGVSSLNQIANWSGADITWAGLLLGLQEKTRLIAWVEQAKQIVAGQEGKPAEASFSGQEDDLKRIRGIDAETETKLKEMGIMSYAQISQFQQADMDKVNEVLGTSGRVERQYWVVQAKVLVDGGETDFSKLYDGSN